MSDPTAAFAPRALGDQPRDHGPHWVRYELAGDGWHDSDAVRALRVRSDEMLLAPLLGHTWGHGAVAVRQSERLARR